MPTNPLISCIKSDASLEEILSSLLVIDNAGNVGLRYKEISAAAGNIDPHPEVICGQPNLDAIGILRRSIQLDLDNKPALVLIRAT